MAVYGNMLAAFGELMEDHTVFKMKPLVSGGYGERYDIRTVIGYWSWRKSGRMGVEGDSRITNHRATFWAQDDFLTGEPIIDQNDFVEKKDGIYLVVEDDNFSHEGGFTKCVMQKVAGLTDRQVTNRQVDENIRGDYA